MACSVEGCNRPIKQIGMCGMHAQRKYRGADLLAPPKYRRGATKRTCKVEKCTNLSDSALGLGVCATHRNIFYRTGDFSRSKRPPGTILTCTISDCQRSYRSSGLCNSHLTRARSYNMSALQLEQFYGDRSCDICGTVTVELHVDHDHLCCPGGKTCGKCVRGKLCAGCNIGLGAFRDNAASLVKAAAYIQRLPHLIN